jgi:hypothetical protein
MQAIGDGHDFAMHDIGKTIGEGITCLKRITGISQ